MKKIYSTLLLLSISFLTYSQAEEFKIDFEGTDPLTNLPSGVSIFEPTAQLTVFLAGDVYRFQSAGAEPTQIAADINYVDGNANGTLATFQNDIIDDPNTSSKVIQMDQTGYVVMDETAFGTDDFSIGMDYMHFGHSMGGGASIFTVTGLDTSDSTWKSEFLRSNTGGFIENFGFYGVAGTDGFQYGKLSGAGVVPEYNHIILTYTSTDQIYKLYKNGVLIASSITSAADTTPLAQESGEWNDRKIYIGLKGADQNQTDGNFDSYAVQTNDRNLDLQKRIDNITVFKRAISESEATILFNNGTLAVNKQTLQTFNAYPNPVNDRLYFSSKAIYSVEVYNILGSKVASQEVIENGVDMSELKSGIYLLKCKDVSGLAIATIKAVKK